MKKTLFLFLACFVLNINSKSIFLGDKYFSYAAGITVLDSEWCEKYLRQKFYHLHLNGKKLHHYKTPKIDPNFINHAVDKKIEFFICFVDESKTKTGRGESIFLFENNDDLQELFSLRYQYDFFMTLLEVKIYHSGQENEIPQIDPEISNCCIIL